jgi:Protein phosphatase 2C
MRWKAIGKSVRGTSHLQSGKPCEDALDYAIITTPLNGEILVCCISDGAGSAKYAAEAAALVTTNTVDYLSKQIMNGNELGEANIIFIAEQVYDELNGIAEQRNEPLNEFSCTFLGCVLFDTKSLFFQIGDGAIIRDDGNNNFVAVWWPQNGEYSNTTSFLIDDHNLCQLKSVVVEDYVQEVALFTDGLQLLTLNNENLSVHQPFFTGMFKWLRMATQTEDLNILNRKLGEYLDSDAINSRTDDDKTLFLATRLSYG